MNYSKFLLNIVFLGLINFAFSTQVFAAQSATETEKLKLDLVDPFQALKDVTINSTFNKLDAMVQAAAIAVATDVSSALASDGDVYIVSKSEITSVSQFTNRIGDPAGEFVGHDSDLAYLLNGTWTFFEPRNGWMVWNEAKEAMYIYHETGDTWAEYFVVFAFGSVGAVNGFTVADDFTRTARFFVDAKHTGGRADIFDATGDLTMALDGQRRTMRLPVIDTAARDAINAVLGDLIFNNDTLKLNYFNGTTWEEASETP